MCLLHLHAFISTPSAHTQASRMRPTHPSSSISSVPFQGRASVLPLLPGDIPGPGALSRPPSLRLLRPTSGISGCAFPTLFPPWSRPPLQLPRASGGEGTGEKKPLLHDISFLPVSSHKAGSCRPWGLKALMILFKLSGNWWELKNLCFESGSGWCLSKTDGLQWPLQTMAEACPERCGSRKLPARLGLAGFAGELAGPEESIPHKCLLQRLLDSFNS